MGQSSFIYTLVFLASAIIVGACAPKAPEGGSSVVKDCVLPTEQQNTLQGHWSTRPIKISFHSGDFSAAEISAIQAGANTWNDFFQASKGITVFDAGAGGSGNQSNLSQAAPTCTGATVSDGTVLYKRYQSWTKAQYAIALTTACFTTQSSGLALMTNAIIEFNYFYFFAPSTGQFPDLQSIAVHELGHLLGLDHSCGPLGRPNTAKAYTVCPDYQGDPSNFMVQAIMFPIVPFSNNGHGGIDGQIRRDPTSNDQGRANCLY